MKLDYQKTKMEPTFNWCLFDNFSIKLKDMLCTVKSSSKSVYPPGHLGDPDQMFFLWFLNYSKIPFNSLRG